MKFSTPALFIVSAAMGATSASAFVAPRNAFGTPSAVRVRSTASKEAAQSIEEETVVTNEGSVADAMPELELPTEKTDPRFRIQPGRYNDLDYSITLPMFQRPTALDGSHAGDYGFDPMGFTETNDLYYLQECETRHARLAMLAVVGWPLAELLAPKWMLQHGCAPSVLNGFNPVSFIATAAVFGAIGFLEYQTSLRRTSGTKIGDKHKSDMENVWNYGVAGDYNFDPANLYSYLGDDAAGRKGLRTLEITQGRYAMLGISYFAFYEALTGHPIVENNMFFHPNAMLPFLGVAYFAWNQIYQLSDLRKYPIKIEYTKDGEQMLTDFDRATEGTKESIAKGAGVIAEATAGPMKAISESLGNLTKDLELPKL